MEAQTKHVQYCPSYCTRHINLRCFDKSALKLALSSYVVRLVVVCEFVVFSKTLMMQMMKRIRGVLCSRRRDVGFCAAVAG